jgi:hypothetical protein
MHYSLSTGGPRVYGNVDRADSTTGLVLRCLRSHCWLLLLSTLCSESVRRIKLNLLLELGSGLDVNVKVYKQSKVKVEDGVQNLSRRYFGPS